MFFGAGIAGISNVAVVEGARRRGLGSAMTHELMGFVSEAGHRSVILHSGEMGRSVYAALEFLVDYNSAPPAGIKNVITLNDNTPTSAPDTDIPR